jgi:hypothetical protein
VQRGLPGVEILPNHAVIDTFGAQGLNGVSIAHCAPWRPP